MDSLDLNNLMCYLLFLRMNLAIPDIENIIRLEINAFFGTLNHGITIYYDSWTAPGNTRETPKPLRIHLISCKTVPAPFI